MTAPTLSPAQLSALEADRLKLIVVPLEVQPPEPSASAWVPLKGNSYRHKAPYLDAYCGARPTPENPRGMQHDLHWWTVDDRCGPPVSRLPFVAGDRIETPHANLIVTDVQVKRVKDVDNYEAMDAGFEGFYTPEGPNSYSSTDAQEPAEHFRHDFTTQYPDAWTNNVWCAFVTVRKEQPHD